MTSPASFAPTGLAIQIRHSAGFALIGRQSQLDPINGFTPMIRRSSAATPSSTARFSFIRLGDFLRIGRHRRLPIRRPLAS